ncbi:2'-5' RNA ligase family protein [Nonomuraea sp. NPDC003804]|uniref:2'-5' RNA ligase family protein n=1 Tax=Nonomuraea sp. NPDC003804 TaxID=3154547 RepID=UPI0033A73457
MERFRIGETALVITVPAAEPVVGRWRERHDPSAAYGVPAHVTVLTPFLPRDLVDARVEAELGRLFAAFTPFEITFRATGRFPGVLYLAPEPDEPLRALTLAVWRHWPEVPPYGGRYPDVVPHLTVADGAPPDACAEIEADLVARLPFVSRVSEVVLLAYDGTAWRQEASFPLGGAADGDDDRPRSPAKVRNEHAEGHDDRRTSRTEVQGEHTDGDDGRSSPLTKMRDEVMDGDDSRPTPLTRVRGEHADGDDHRPSPLAEVRGEAVDGDYGRPGSLAEVLADVAAERVAQDVMFGVQDPADGTGPERTAAADRAKADLETAKRAGAVTWRHILHEEVLEAFAESDPDRLRAELIQVAAVAVKWAQALGGRGATLPHQVKRARFKAIVDVHVLFVCDGKVLLGRRANTGYADGRWHLPSGHLEAGESVIEAAAREAREEVGVVVDPGDLTFVHAMHRAPDRVGLFFRAERWHGEPYNAEPGKCDALEWHPLDRLPDGMVAYPAAALAAIGDGRPFAQFGF